MGEAWPIGASKVIDRSVLGRALEEFGDEAAEIFAQLLETYSSDTPSLIAQIAEAAQRGELIQIGRIAHRLKGSCSQMGAIAMSATAERVEQAAAAGSADELFHAVGELPALWQQTSAELNDWLTAVTRGD
ncbi:MAG: Hpt domain-containing protein [Methylotetracoccus sp.]